MSRVVSYVCASFLLVGCVGDDSAAPPDAGADATTDVVSSDVVADAGWSPASLSTLALWLNGDTATADVSDKITHWSDQSPNHNDAVQTNENSAPGFAVSPVNGHKAVHFDGTVPTFLTLTDTASLEWNQSFLIEIVLRHPAATGMESYALYVKQSLSAPNAGPAVFIMAGSGSPHTSYIAFQIVAGMAVGDATSTAIADLVPQRVHVSYDGTNLAVDVGAKTSTTAMGSTDAGVGAAGAAAYIGCVDGITNYLTGDIAELVALAGPSINPSDVAMLESYLDTKYNVQ